MKAFFLHTVISLIAVLTTTAKTTDLPQRLDSIIDNVGELYARKETRIDTYKNIAAKEKHPIALLSAYEKLYDEYYVYQFDSAIVYINKAITLVQHTGNAFFHDKCRIEKASLLSIGGFYHEAIALLGEIDSTSIDASLRFSYTTAHYYLYMYLSDYCHDNNYAPRYRKLAASYLRQAVGMLHEGDRLYDFFWGEYYTHVAHNSKMALKHYFRVTRSMPKASRWYAMATFAIANNYKANNNPDKYEHYTLLACISDLLNCTRENIAMQDYAMLLYQKNDGDIQRAERYINFALDDAKNYNNRLRILEISQKLPAIVKNYREKTTRQNRIMRATICCISILMACMVALLCSYRAKNRQLHWHRRELSDRNKQLSNLNGTLNGLNQRLVDTDKRRERLAKLYIDLCAKFIDRLGKFEILVRRKIKAGQVNDLLNRTSSSRLSEEDASTFMVRFDAAFLDLYPSFVTEFNTLLKPDEQVVPHHAGCLTTELRIFALIRLGVKESSEIAALLFYTPRTIYNYRSAFKNKALCRETFESDVMKLCTVIQRADNETA